jgi:uncharacterized membrane protein YdbT with pleckstrin-like domain
MAKDVILNYFQKPAEKSSTKDKRTLMTKLPPMLDNERMIYQGQINPFFEALAILGAIGLITMIKSPALGSFVVFVSMVSAIGNYIKLKTSIFLVTNKRVIIQIGLLTHRALELNLNKLESIYVESTFLDRQNKMGTLVVVGTGGTKEAFKNIVDPHTFKLKVQEQLEQLNSPKVA